MSLVDKDAICAQGLGHFIIVGSISNEENLVGIDIDLLYQLLANLHLALGMQVTKPGNMIKIVGNAEVMNNLM